MHGGLCRACFALGTAVQSLLGQAWGAGLGFSFFHLGVVQNGPLNFKQAKVLKTVS